MLRTIISLFLCYCSISFASVAQTTLPVTFNSGNHSPYGMATVHIKINNKTIPVLIDLGASKTNLTLTPYALKNLKIKKLNEKICGMTITGKVCMPVVLIRKIKLGQFVLHNIKATVVSHLWGGPIPKAHHLGGFRYGIIGLQLLRKYTTYFNFPNNQITLIQPSRYQKNIFYHHWLYIPFKINGGIETTMVINSNKKGKFIWDTGAIPSIVNTESYFKKYSSACNSGFHYGEKICKLFKTHGLTSHGVVLPNTWFLLKAIPKQVPFTGLIGSNFFMQHQVVINFSQKRIYVASAE